MTASGDFILAPIIMWCARAGNTRRGLRLSRRADRASAPVRRCAGRAPSPPISCGIAPSPPGACSARVLDGVWIHVGTPEARDEAEAYLAALSGGVKHPAVFTIAASAPFAETLARGLIARAGRRSAGAVFGHHLPAHPARGAQFRRRLRPGDGRRGAAAAVPPAGRQRGRRTAVRCRQRGTGACARHRAACGGNCCWRG